MDRIGLRVLLPLLLILSVSIAEDLTACEKRYFYGGLLPVERGGTFRDFWNALSIPYLSDNNVFDEITIGLPDQILSVNPTGNGYVWINQINTSNITINTSIIVAGANYSVSSSYANRSAMSNWSAGASYSNMTANNSHLHNAANITNGTFGYGNYTFLGNVTLNDSLSWGNSVGSNDLRFLMWFAAHPYNPLADGFRMYYDYSLEDGPFDDWLIIQKTDGNDAVPDGGIGFAMTNMSNDTFYPLKLYGNGLANFSNSLLVGDNVTADWFIGNISCSNITGAVSDLCTITSGSTGIINYSVSSGYSNYSSTSGMTNYSASSQHCNGSSFANYSLYAQQANYSISSLYANDSYRSNYSIGSSMTNYSVSSSYSNASSVSNQSVYSQGTGLSNYSIGASFSNSSGYSNYSIGSGMTNYSIGSQYSNNSAFCNTSGVTNQANYSYGSSFANYSLFSQQTNYSLYAGTVNYSGIANGPVACPANTFMTHSDFAGNTVTCTSVQETPLSLKVDVNLTVVGNVTAGGNVTASYFLGSLNCSNITGATSNLCTIVQPGAIGMINYSVSSGYSNNSAYSNTSGVTNTANWSIGSSGSNFSTSSGYANASATANWSTASGLSNTANYSIGTSTSNYSVSGKYSNNSAYANTSLVAHQSNYSYNSAFSNTSAITNTANWSIGTGTSNYSVSAQYCNSSSVSNSTTTWSGFTSAFNLANTHTHNAANITAGVFGTGNFYFDGDVFPQSTLSYDLGSGANRWDFLYVRNISAENIATYNLTMTGDLNMSGRNITNVNELHFQNSSGSQVWVTYVNSAGALVTVFEG